MSIHIGLESNGSTRRGAAFLVLHIQWIDDRLRLGSGRYQAQRKHSKRQDNNQGFASSRLAQNPLHLPPTIWTLQRQQRPDTTMNDDAAERHNGGEASARVGTFAMVLRSTRPSRLSEQFRSTRVLNTHI